MRYTMLWLQTWQESWKQFWLIYASPQTLMGGGMVQRSRSNLKFTSYEWNECKTWEAFVGKDQQFFGKQARQGALLWWPCTKSAWIFTHCNYCEFCPPVSLFACYATALVSMTSWLPYATYLYSDMSHSQMLGKFEYTLPAKFWRLVGCTEMLSW